MIHASIRMKFPVKEFAQARNVLSALVERTSVSLECAGCYLYQDVREARVLLLEQWWKSEADLNRHLRSDLYRQVILIMEMASELPVVRFSEISLSTGIETVAQSRGVDDSDPSSSRAADRNNFSTRAFRPVRAKAVDVQSSP